MPDGYGPDPFMKSLFWHEAQAGPSQQELAGMAAPFSGSPEQALAFMQSPDVQARMKQMGINPLDPRQIRQSPFMPNQFMQAHPMMGGIMNRALATAAATSEAPLISGAGSGISRMAQGAFGGPEMLRQYQVRQMMAPFQAMGMQLPVMAEQRRQELLQALEDDMNKRRGLEQQLLPERQALDAEKNRIALERIQQQREAAEGKVTKPQPTPYGILSPGGLQFQPGPEGMPAELGGQISGQAPPQGSMQLPGGEIFTPYPTEMLAGFTGARYPGQVATADQKKAETTAGLPQAKVDELKARSDKERKQGDAAGRAGAGRQGKDLAALEKEKAAAYARLEQRYAPYTGYQGEGKAAIQPVAPQGYTAEQWEAEKKSRIAQMQAEKQRIEDTYATERGLEGVPVPGVIYPGQTSTYGGSGTGTFAGAGSAVNPGAQSPGQSTSGLPAGYEFDANGVPQRMQSSQGVPRQ